MSYHVATTHKFIGRLVAHISQVLCTQIMY
jgi:hypothetical protein